MCTELLPPGGYPVAVKYIISYRILYLYISLKTTINIFISFTFLLWFCTDLDGVCNGLNMYHNCVKTIHFTTNFFLYFNVIV